MSVIHPDTTTTMTAVIEYDPLTSIAPQPPVDILFSFATEYTPPPSSGGQPAVVTTMSFTTLLEPQVVTMDASGTAEIVFTTSGKAEVELAPIQIPAGVEFVETNVISVTMPRPTELDQFGRPIS